MSKPLRIIGNKPRLRGLYAITDDHLILAGQVIEYVAQALQGGASMIQYRDKSRHAMRREQEVRALLELCRAHQVPLIINDDIMLASITGADGVHLGRDDQSLADARAKLGPGAIIGISCYGSLDLAIQAQATGADYVAFGSFFPSHTKPQAALVESDLLNQAKAQLDIPVAAIGGITPARGAGLIAAGADLLAVVHGVFGQPDVTEAARNYAQLFTDKDKK